MALLVLLKPASGIWLFFPQAVLAFAVCPNASAAQARAVELSEHP